MPIMSILHAQDDLGVDYAYTPRSVANGVATYVRSTGTPIGDSRVTVSVTQNANGRYKIVVKLTDPVVQTAADLSGVVKTTLLRTGYLDMTITVDATSTAHERKALIQKMWWLLSANMSDGNPSPLQAVVGNLENLY